MSVMDAVQLCENVPYYGLPEDWKCMQSPQYIFMDSYMEL